MLVIIFAGGIGKLVGKSTSESFFEGKKASELNTALIQTASQINQNLPMMIDSETHVDSTIGLNKQFRYNYTMVNYSAEELNPKGFTKAMQSQLINRVRTTKEMEVLMKNDVPVTYAYHGKSGKQFTTITVLPSQCKSS